MMIAVLTLILITSGTTADSDYELEPTPKNVTIGQAAEFQCKLVGDFISIWRVDGQVPRNDDTCIFSFDNSHGLDTMTIKCSCPGHNNCSYRITCCVRKDATLTAEVCTEDAVLMIQGPLNHVNNLVRENSTLIWSAPFSLDLSDIEVDIIYCVEVYNVTCGTRNLVIHDCNATGTTYTNDVLASGYLLEIIVTPRSNVEGATNGASQTLRDKLPVFTVNSAQVSVNLDGESMRVVLSFNIKENSKQSSFTLLLDPLDGLGDAFEVQTYTERNGKFLTLNVPGLPAKRLWNFTVLAYGCQSHIVLSSAELSTHYIQNVSVTSMRPGELRVTGDIVGGSTATGILIVAIGKNISYYFIPRSGTEVDGFLSGLPASSYDLSVFVMEESGLSFERVAARPISISVDIGDNRRQYSIEYDVQPTTTGVCINCNFLDSYTTDCVAVVHQRISQLNSSGLMNIESSYKFNRSGDTASGCIDGVNLMELEVGVIQGKLLPLHHSTASVTCTWCIVVPVWAAVLVSIIVAIFVIIRIYWLKKNNASQPKTVPDENIPSILSRATLHGAASNQLVMSVGDLPTHHDESVGNVNLPAHLVTEQNLKDVLCATPNSTNRDPQPQPTIPQVNHNPLQKTTATLNETKVEVYSNFRQTDHEVEVVPVQEESKFTVEGVGGSVSVLNSESLPQGPLKQPEGAIMDKTKYNKQNSPSASQRDGEGKTPVTLPVSYLNNLDPPVPCLAVEKGLKGDDNSEEDLFSCCRAIQASQNSRSGTEGFTQVTTLPANKFGDSSGSQKDKVFKGFSQSVEDQSESPKDANKILKIPSPQNLLPEKICGKQQRNLSLVFYIGIPCLVGIILCAYYCYYYWCTDTAVCTKDEGGSPRQTEVDKKVEPKDELLVNGSGSYTTSTV